VEIRTAEKTEYEAIADITVNAYVEEALRNGSADSVGDGSHFNSAYVPALRDVAGRARDAVVLVAIEEDSVLGAVTYVPGLGPYAEFDDRDAAGIRMLAVAPEAQGRGVGTALVRACLDRARAEGRARVVLHSTPWMATAGRMYARLGFRRAPERDWTPAPGVDLQGYEFEFAPLRD
jgi:predicted N-acetyltransferase YhbS